MTQMFVDPSSLSLPSSSLKRSVSPASTDDVPSPLPMDDPPRKRSRSAVTPEERKEARAHRNRIAAQNSRDRRKAQFTYLERRVAVLEEENRRLRAGIHVSPSPSTPPISEPDVSPVEDQEHQRKQEQRDLENQELRERIRTLENGYEAVVRALAAQSPVTSSIPTSPSVPSTAAPSHLSFSPQPASHDPSSPTSSLPVSLSSASSLSLSPSSSNSTLVDSPILFTSGDSFDSPKSPTLSLSETSFTLNHESLDLSLAISSPTRHLARVANTVGRSTVSPQRVGGAQMVTGPPEDEATSDIAITRLFAEILASPPLGTSALPSFGTSSEDALSKEMLTKTETSPSEGLGLGIGMNGLDTVDWVERVLAEMEMDTTFGSPAFISPLPPLLPSCQTAPSSDLYS